MSKYNSGADLIRDAAHEPSPVAQSELTMEAAYDYIRVMLNELSRIAEGAQLKDIEALLKVTVTAVEINGRFL